MRTMHVVAVFTIPVFAMGVAVVPAGAALTGSNDAMSVSDLPNSVVPANCEMPRQRLHHNKTARKYLPKQGWINLSRPGRPIYAHLQPGRNDVVATYSCTAGGVGWPQVIVAYSPQGRLIDGLDLYHFSHQEEATVTGWRAVGHSVRMHWISEDGCCTNEHHYHSRIRLSHGRLVLNPIR